jgi:hypothetical protein
MDVFKFDRVAPFEWNLEVSIHRVLHEGDIGNPLPASIGVLFTIGITALMERSITRQNRDVGTEV